MSDPSPDHVRHLDLHPRHSKKRRHDSLSVQSHEPVDVQLPDGRSARGNAEPREIHIIGDDDDSVTTMRGMGTEADPVMFFEWTSGNVITDGDKHVISLMSDDEEDEDDGDATSTQRRSVEHGERELTASTISSIEYGSENGFTNKNQGVVPLLSDEDGDDERFSSTSPSVEHGKVTPTPTSRSSSPSRDISPTYGSFGLNSYTYSNSRPFNNFFTAFPPSSTDTLDHERANSLDAPSDHESHNLLTRFGTAQGQRASSMCSRESTVTLANGTPLSSRAPTPMEIDNPLLSRSVTVGADSVNSDNERNSWGEDEDGESRIVSESRTDSDYRIDGESLEDDDEDNAGHPTDEDLNIDIDRFRRYIVIDCDDDEDEEDEESQLLRVSNQIPRWESWSHNNDIKAEPNTTDASDNLGGIKKSQAFSCQIVINCDDSDGDEEEQVAKISSQIPLWKDWSAYEAIKPDPDEDVVTPESPEKSQEILQTKSSGLLAPSAHHQPSTPPLPATPSPEPSSSAAQRDLTIYKKHLFYTHYYKRHIHRLHKRIANLTQRYVTIPSQNPNTSCHLYDGPTNGHSNNIALKIQFTHKSTTYYLTLNFGAVHLLINDRLSAEEIDGYVHKWWHTSHLCGNWRCVNLEHVRAEPGDVNLSRNNCLRPRGEEGRERAVCGHVPRCLVEKTLEIPEEDRARRRARCGGGEVGADAEAIGREGGSDAENQRGDETVGS